MASDPGPVQLSTRKSEMSKLAWAYIATVLTAGAVLAGMTFQNPTASLDAYIKLLVLVVLATISQLNKSVFEVKRQDEEGTLSFAPNLIFFAGGALLLPAPLFVLLILIPHLIEWIDERGHNTRHLPRWYIQPFNIAVHLIAGLGARWVFETLHSTMGLAHLQSEFFPSLAAILVYVLLNHFLIGEALALARNVTWKESTALARDGLEPDLMMAGMGAALALLWRIDAWSIILGLAPLVMIQRALAIPQLKHEARVDTKTGLWNAHHLDELCQAELKRARRFERPMAVIMADLDMMRNINNSYGHVAGDQVLQGIGKIIREAIREYDIAGRFGGEEFVIAMPEASLNDAETLAERMRRRIEQTEFRSPTVHTPIHVTISLGIAHFPEDGKNTTELIHAADVAVYRAKLDGRNRVVAYNSLLLGPDLTEIKSLIGALPIKTR